jgi:hypothetical protein
VWGRIRLRVGWRSKRGGKVIKEKEGAEDENNYEAWITFLSSI